MKDIFNSIGVSRLRVASDGDGITTLVAGTNCPSRCKYCLNPQCFENEKPWKTFTLQELIDTVAIDDLYFQATGGGVVFGGGEPLLQADFIHEFKKACPKEWKIYLESSLSVPNNIFKMVDGDIDFYLIDIKDMNPDIYLAYTGKSNDNTIANLKHLAANVDPSKVVIRLPLIPGFNTDADRDSSEAILKSMGFTRFDRFTYDIDKSQNKRKNCPEV